MLKKEHMIVIIKHDTKETLIRKLILKLNFYSQYVGSVTTTMYNYEITYNIFLHLIIIGYA